VSGKLLKAYHALPEWAQSIAAAGRGVYLSCWRYDRNTEQLVSQALARDTWTSEQWKVWQADRLSYILHRAATAVPFYQAFWAKQSLSAGQKPWLVLESWPILEKEEVRKNPRAFVAKDCRTWRMFPEHTSGTSGTPLTLWRRRQTQIAWYGLLEARLRRWHSVSLHDRWAILGGQSIVPVSRKTPPFWIWNPALHQLYLSSFHLSQEFSQYYLDAIRLYEVKYLLGYTSAIEFLAREVLRMGITHLKMTIVLTNAEPVSTRQRNVISEAFQCSLRDSYGMAEMVAAASECPAGKMHLWPEVGLIEVVDENGRVPDGIFGDLVCTGLLNEDMPLIRYRVGDSGAIEPIGDSPCECGRRLPMLATLEGRTDDVLQTADGRQIGRLDPIFKGGLPVIEAQIVQETLTRIRVRFVPSSDYSGDSAIRLMNAVRDYVGPMEMILEPLARIPREPNGKFRAVVSRLNEADKRGKQPRRGKQIDSSQAQ
jgi:phenylacetate-CoA ligase